MGDLLLGVDIGTSSSKGVLVRPDGTIVATAQRAHQLSLPRPGWAEHDGETVWWADFVAIARELTAGTAGSGDRVAAVGVSGIGPAVLPVDGAGASLRPAILYGIDTRATREVDEMTERFGPDAALIGMGFVSGLVFAPAIWITQSFGQKVVSRMNSVSTVTVSKRDRRSQAAASSAVVVRIVMTVL